jgi:penicillin amidase
MARLPARPLARLALRAALGRRLPLASGRLRVAGIAGAVRIARDGWGVPHIEADSEPDAWFGLGFAHGQDRAFQLELIARLVRGTLAELLGPEALPADRCSRRIGFQRAAAGRWPAMDPELGRIAEAYAAGVTRGATDGLPRRPHEFALLRSRPSPYAATDAIGMLLVLSYALASNWDSELMRWRVFQQDGPEAVEALDPRYPRWLPSALEVAAGERAPAGGRGGGPEVEPVAADLGRFLAYAGAGGGSNNWALAGRKTASGRPILANDPHLSPNLPAHWYLASVRAPGWAARGATFVGAPGIVIGHNEHVAWGITAGLLDNTDLFVEELGPDGRSVRSAGGFAACEVRRETIRVRGAAPVEEEVLITPRGPLLFPPAPGERHGLSLRASWLDPLPIRGFLRAHHARSIGELFQEFAEWPVLPVNLAGAAAAGEVGWLLAGRAPVRKKGHGLFPLAGWDPEAGWEAAVPFAEMPRAVDPPSGFVATANQAPLPAGAAPYLGADWIDGYRLERIREALAARDDWDVAETLALQTDVESIPWRELRDVVLAAAAEPLAPPGADGRAVLAILAGWDGKMSAGSAAASIFAAFLAEMAARVARAKAPRGADWVLGRSASPLAVRSTLAVRRVAHLSRLLREQPPGWFAHPWSAEVASALAAAAGRWRREFGADPARWEWGRVRGFRFRHPLGVKRVLSPLFDRGPYPARGDSNTIAQAAVDPFDPAAPPLYVASLRVVIDAGRWERSRFILPGGQSGNPLSPHYDDQLAVYLRGEALELPWTPAEAAAAAEHRLVLEPPAAP